MSDRFIVRCSQCEHVWIAAYLPMELRKAAQLVGALHCPKCGTGSKGIFMASKEQAAPFLETAP